MIPQSRVIRSWQVSAADLLNGTGMPAATEMRCNWDAMKPKLIGCPDWQGDPKPMPPRPCQTAAETCVAGLSKTVMQGRGDGLIRNPSPQSNDRDRYLARSN